MTEKVSKYEKSPDYATVYADGVVFESGIEGVGRLIFYQKERKLNDELGQFDKTEDIKILKFEVRIPRFVLTNLAQNVRYRDRARAKGMELAQMKQDEKTIKEFYTYSKELSEILFDTEFIGSDDDPNAKEIQSVQDKFEGLLGRAMKDLDKNDKDI